MATNLAIVSKNEIEQSHPIIEIIPMEAKHVRMLADNIRRADMDEILAVGFTPYKATLSSYRASLIPQAAFINGKLSAVWGVCGNPLGDEGHPWLLTTDEVYNISALRFAKIYQRECAKMLRIFPILTNYVDSRYTSAIRLLNIIGFTVDEPEPYGENGIMFHKFWKVSNGN